MSKKVSFPVMSLTLTGALYIIGLLVLSMKTFLITVNVYNPLNLLLNPYEALLSPLKPIEIANLSLTYSLWSLLNGVLGFLGAFLMIWALTSLCLHPDIDDSNVKAVFITFTAFFILLIFTNGTLLTLTLK